MKCFTPTAVTDTELDLGIRGCPYVVSGKSLIPDHVPNCAHLNDRHTRIVNNTQCMFYVL